MRRLLSRSSTEDGQVCHDTNTATAGLILPSVSGHGQIALCLERLVLNGGRCYTDVGIYEHTWAYTYDYHWHVYPLLIDSPQRAQGLLYPPSSWQIDLFSGVKKH